MSGLPENEPRDQSVTQPGAVSDHKPNVDPAPTNQPIQSTDTAGEEA